MLAKNLYFTLHFRNESNACERTHPLFLGITRVLNSYFYYYYKNPLPLPSIFSVSRNFLEISCFNSLLFTFSNELHCLL